MLRFTWLCVIIIAVFMSFFIAKQHSNNMDYNKDIRNDSSVWCTNYSNSQLCTFKNICYDKYIMSFIFFLGNQSVIKGLPSYRAFQTIQLSSVSSHNKFQANVSVSTVYNYDIKRAEFIKKGLLFSRFKPDNIMHVIHDDLIPIYLTLEEICLGDMVYCTSNFQLIMHDDYPKGPYFKLYEVFSSVNPVILAKLPEKTVLCFDELHMGLILDSIFYQYGFNKPQGPLESIKLTANDLYRFVNFIKNKLEIEDYVNNINKSNVLLVSRKKTRHILNENDLIKMLRVYSDIEEVIVLDLMENNTEVFFKEIQRTSTLIGMHGAEMIFGIFLKPNSTIIELFPYGIDSNAVSFIKPLAKIEGIYFKYIEWTNPYKDLTVFHPEADPLLGGINHLPQNIQNEIKSVKKVPAVNCCNNPMYLYYIYQDTWIHPNFEEFLKIEMKKTDTSGSRSSNLIERWFFPWVVTNITCSYDIQNKLFYLSWKKPYNIDKELVYDIAVMESYSNFVRNIMTENNFIKLNVNVKKPFKFQVWIAAIFKKNHAKSRDSFLNCV